MIENTSGSLVPGGNIISIFGLENAKETEPEFFPTDPFEAADMEIALHQFDKLAEPVFECYHTGFAD